MSKNVVLPDRPRMTIWRMRVARCISEGTRAQAHASACALKPTHALPTHIEVWNTYCFSTGKMVTWTRLNVTLYVHWLSCWMLNWWYIMLPLGLKGLVQSRWRKIGDNWTHDVTVVTNVVWHFHNPSHIKQHTKVVDKRISNSVKCKQ